MSITWSISTLFVIALLSYPLGVWITKVMEGNFHFRKGKQSNAVVPNQNWKSYTISLLVFNGLSFVLAGLVLGLQHVLPLNPDHMGRIPVSLLFHTLASFVTNTNQQHYAGEATMSYASQIFGLMWLQFISAGTGIAALVAVARGLSGNSEMGDFHSDLRRSILYILLPLSILEAAFLVLSGVPMTFHGSASVTTLEGASQIIARGPVAVFMAIKQLGTNGGGFFGANSAHPYENPTFLTNWVETFSILILPMACVWVYGKITGKMKHAVVLFGVMLLFLIVLLSWGAYVERKPIEVAHNLNVTQTPNLEGKELRFGGNAGTLWAVSTTCTSNGSVNCMHDSLHPLTGLVALIGMWINSIFGGVGVGMLNMLIYIIIGVFICGMMVGRSPEYFQRKIETKEMRLASLALLLHPLLILFTTAWFCTNGWGVSSIHNPGAHGFSEILYEFTSASANNGSGFEGLQDGTANWNIICGIVMLLGRYIPIIIPLMIAGSMASKQAMPETKGTFRTDTPLFGVILLMSILLIGALLFLPVAILGPVSEALGRVQG